MTTLRISLVSVYLTLLAFYIFNRDYWHLVSFSTSLIVWHSTLQEFDIPFALALCLAFAVIEYYIGFPVGLIVSFLL